MAVLITPTVLGVGSSVSSDVLALGEAIEFIFTASSTVKTFPSLVRIVVEGLRAGETSFRPVGTHLLEDTATVVYTLAQPPSKVRIRAECLSGRSLVSAETVERKTPKVPSPDLNASPGDVLIVGPDGNLTGLDPPPPNHYFGTNSFGDVGYYALPTGGSSRVWNEVPVGGIDGTNDEFLLSTLPVAGTLQLFRNGILRREGAAEDFVLSGALIKYNPGAVPQPGDTHIASYNF